jgi:hypothetical protein
VATSLADRGCERADARHDGNHPSGTRRKPMPTGRIFKAGVLAATGAALVLTGCSDNDDSAQETADSVVDDVREDASDAWGDFTNGVSQLESDAEDAQHDTADEFRTLVADFRTGLDDLRSDFESGVDDVPDAARQDFEDLQAGVDDIERHIEEAGDDFDAGLQELWSDVKSDFEDIKNDL